ncbi:acyltransferase [Parabacteroides sp. FAFU027]|uniref:acyltransferase n=1 Tax=Parabacteroides sp. FAFU027 TaxID=2922715 RepID=UPI001FAFDA69|nr:acyltransferase [Parabacteroides sp. FAFU027]
MNSFYSDNELLELGLKSFGKNVLISRKASLYSPEKINIGDNVRIDDFCILSGQITLGSFIHISAFSAIYGAYGVEIRDFSGLSPRCTIFSAMDDFSGEYLVNPMVEKSKTKVVGGKVLLDKFVQVGSGSVIFPSLTIEEGVVIGAMSLVKNSLSSWGIYVGIPVRRIKERSKNLLTRL